MGQLYRAITLDKRDSTDFAFRPRAVKTDQKSVNWSLFLCTYLLAGKTSSPLQHFFRCKTCSFDDVCVVCVHKCHQGHVTRYTGQFRVHFCDCGHRKACAKSGSPRNAVEEMQDEEEDEDEREEGEAEAPSDSDSSLSTIVDSDGDMDDEDADLNNIL